jgi:hypothetical protein
MEGLGSGGCCLDCGFLVYLDTRIWTTPVTAFLRQTPPVDVRKVGRRYDRHFHSRAEMSQGPADGGALCLVWSVLRLGRLKNRAVQLAATVVTLAGREHLAKYHPKGCWPGAVGAYLPGPVVCGGLKPAVAGTIGGRVGHTPLDGRYGSQRPTAEICGPAGWSGIRCLGEGWAQESA